MEEKTTKNTVKELKDNEAPVIEKAVETETVAKKVSTKKTISANLKDISGKSVADKDYFFEGVVLPSFLITCGVPVIREDLVDVFNKVFKPEDGILFYKQTDKEVYIVIVPIKYSTSIGEHNNSITGDFQKHAISFLNEGSVNVDTLKAKLERIKKFVKYTDR